MHLPPKLKTWPRACLAVLLNGKTSLLRCAFCQQIGRSKVSAFAINVVETGRRERSTARFNQTPNVTGSYPTVSSYPL